MIGTDVEFVVRDGPMGKEILWVFDASSLLLLMEVQAGLEVEVPSKRRFTRGDVRGALTASEAWAWSSP